MSAHRPRSQRQFPYATCATHFFGDASGITTIERVQNFDTVSAVNRNGRAYVPVLEDATHVGFHVTLSRACRGRRGCDRIGARIGQHDAWRFTQPLAEADAVARTATIRRHNYHYGDDLGHGPLTKEEARAHFIGAARIYSTFSFGCFGFFFFVAAE